jgi:hypothetical protein
VIHFYCPAYEGLSIKNIFESWGTHEGFQQYLPIPKEAYRLKKAVIANIAASVIGAEFMTWVRGRIEVRNQKVTEKRNMMVSMDVDIY